jgi:hypothetical protein
MPNEVSSGGGGYPQGSSLEARVTAVEVRLTRIETAVDGIRLDLAEIKGKLSNLPTTFQLLYMQAGLILAIFAAAFGLLRLAAPH